MPRIPAPLDTIPDGFTETVEAAGHTIAYASDGWLVDDEDYIVALASTFVGSATELAHKRARRLNELAGIYADKFVAGWTDPTSGRPVQIDPESQGKLTAQALVALIAKTTGVWDSNFFWIAADNSHIPLASPDAMLIFAEGAGAYVAKLIFTNRALKDAIEAAPDLATLNAIDLTANWPTG